jgi:hypothetical protein
MSQPQELLHKLKMLTGVVEVMDEKLGLGVF